jgi:outer membrane protein, multidrug efflux system
VLDAQRTLYGAQRTLVTTTLTRAVNLVTLYRTLGGDLETRDGPTATGPISTLPPAPEPVRR